MNIIFKDTIVEELKPLFEQSENIINHYCGSSYGLLLTVEVKNNPRLTRALGRCTKNLFSEKTFAEISIATEVLSFTEKQKMEIIIHELLHAIMPIKEGHKGRWLYYANLISENTNYNIQRVATDIETESDKNPCFKYMIKCPTCDKIIYATNRRTNSINNIERCYCKICKNENLILIEN